MSQLQLLLASQFLQRERERENWGRRQFIGKLKKAALRGSQNGRNGQRRKGWGIKESREEKDR